MSGRPRKVGGGRSARYDERRAARDVKGQYCAEWSGAAAKVVLEGLHASNALGKKKFGEHIRALLSSEEERSRFERKYCRTLSGADRSLVKEILGTHAGRWAYSKTKAAQDRCVRSMLKPLRLRAAARGAVGPLMLTSPEREGGTFHKWLSAHPEKDRMRTMNPEGRTAEGLRAWELGWLTGQGAVCFEVATGRANAERGGVVDEQFARSLVRREILPTATASASDHFILVGPGGGARYFTVQEVARAFGLSPESPLYITLATEGVMRPIQAASALGRSVHVGVARLLVQTLRSRGVIGEETTYGSAFSGVDSFAAALHCELGRGMQYKFASEPEASSRRALLHAWGRSGLMEERCHYDARGEGALGEERVDIWVATPECQEFSRRNHGRNHSAQCASAGVVWESLGYVRTRRPKAVIVENVNEASVTGLLTGMLGRITGYEMESGVLDPQGTLGEPMARERRFWVLMRKDE